jgi:hypothetical protein
MRRSQRRPEPTLGQIAASLREAIEPLTNLAVEIGFEMSITPGYEHARSTYHIQSMACAGDKARTSYDQDPRSQTSWQQLRTATEILMLFTRSFANAFSQMPGYGGAGSIRRYRRWSRIAETTIKKYDATLTTPNGKGNDDAEYN